MLREWHRSTHAWSLRYSYGNFCYILRSDIRNFLYVRHSVNKSASIKSLNLTPCQNLWSTYFFFCLQRNVRSNMLNCQCTFVGKHIWNLALRLLSIIKCVSKKIKSSKFSSPWRKGQWNRKTQRSVKDKCCLPNGRKISSRKNITETERLLFRSS